MTSTASRALAAACTVVALASGCGAAATTVPAPTIPAPPAAELTAPDVDAWLDARARVMTRIAAVAAVLGLAAWTTVILVIMGELEVPEALIRVAQGAQWVGVLGVLPAAFVVITSVRHRAGMIRIAGGVCLLLALAGTAWFAQAFGLLSPDISY